MREESSRILNSSYLIQIHFAREFYYKIHEK